MQAIVIVVTIGLLGGVAVGIQAPLASLISNRLGVLESVFIVHMGGAVAAAIPLLLMGGGKLGAWRSLPWYAPWTGVLGLIVLSAISYTIPRLGIAPTVVLLVVAQLIIGALLDHFGWLGAASRPINLSRIIGIAVLFLGTWLMVRQ